MELNQNAKDLLYNLRRTIDEALAESFSVLGAISELEEAGFSPSVSIDITLPVSIPEEAEPQPTKPMSLDEGLILADSDKLFLRNLGISAYS